MQLSAKQWIESGNAALGIELGSTRIKAVLLGENNAPLASGSYQWQNQLVDGYFTYALEDAWAGVQACYAFLAQAALQQYGAKLQKLGAIGISGMMHGYLPFDKQGALLAPFRTWRNTNTAQAAAQLTQAFRFNVPHRWSVAHLYQAVLNGEIHVAGLHTLTTLAGYVHWRLTGQNVLGIGDASGMFPVDSSTLQYSRPMLDVFNGLVAPYGFGWQLEKVLPKILVAGQPAGRLTLQGARLLDPTGLLQPGCPLCPPEGDAGTGMVATNSVAPCTANVSAGTSIFAMAVLPAPLAKLHPEIDVLATPTGSVVAMVHCNNCTGELDAWVSLFAQALAAAGKPVAKAELYDILYKQALLGAPDCGGVLSYNYVAGEPITGLNAGCPLLVRQPDAQLTLPNFMRAMLFSALATLAIGMDILTQEEQVIVKLITGHGGFFKTQGVGQQLMAAALHTPVAVMESAGEGGAWGIALLAAYLKHAKQGKTLESFLQAEVFAQAKVECVQPNKQDCAGFKAFMQRYKAGLAVEHAAVENLH